MEVHVEDRLGARRAIVLDELKPGCAEFAPLRFGRVLDDDHQALEFSRSQPE